MKSISGHKLREHTSHGSWSSSQHQPIQSWFYPCKRARLKRSSVSTAAESLISIYLNSFLPFLLMALARYHIDSAMLSLSTLNYSTSAGRDRWLFKRLFPAVSPIVMDHSRAGLSLVFFDSGPFLFCRHTRVMELYRARRHRQDNISCTWKSCCCRPVILLYSRALPTRIIRARRRSCEESSGRFPVFHNPLSILV